MRNWHINWTTFTKQTNIEMEALGKYSNSSSK